MYCSLLFGLLDCFLGGSSCHAMKILKQLCGEANIERNCALLPIDIICHWEQ